MKRTVADRSEDAVAASREEHAAHGPILQTKWKEKQSRWYVKVSVGSMRVEKAAYTLEEVIETRADLRKKRLDWFSMSRAFRCMHQSSTHPDEEWRSVSSQYEI